MSLRFSLHLSRYFLGCFQVPVSIVWLHYLKHLSSVFPRYPRVNSLALFLAANLICSSPDMLVIGFQEIVPLTAQQIVQTDPEKRYACTPYLKVIGPTNFA